jgi:hypothetical protein
MRIGVVSDTHGYLDPRALTALQGVDRIIHAGDIGDLAVISALDDIAPVIAVRGNVDAGTPLARQFQPVAQVTWEDVHIFVTHVGGKPANLVTMLPAPRPDVYIFGHTHVALKETLEGVLFLNPGAAGHPRFGGSVSVALIDVEHGHATAQIVMLEDQESGVRSPESEVR